MLVSADLRGQGVATFLKFLLALQPKVVIGLFCNVLCRSHASSRHNVLHPANQHPS